MATFLRTTLLPMLALAVLAVLAALVANATASPARHLAWSGSIVMVPASAPMAAPALPPPVMPGPTSEPPTKAAPASAPRHPAAHAPIPPAPGAAPSGPIREVSGAEVWAAFRAGAAFLDARRSAEYAEGHIAGAWCTPVWESDLEDRLIAFKAARRPGPDDPIVIYCSGGDCRDSHLLADRLLQEGYFHLLIYRDGFPDWLAQRRPVEKGQP